MIVRGMILNDDVDGDRRRMNVKCIYLMFGCNDLNVISNLYHDRIDADTA